MSKSIAVFFLLCASSSGALIVTSASLAGANENPVNASPGTGYAVVTLDTVAHTLRVQAWFDDLTAAVTAAHIHCCTDFPNNAMVATQTPSFIGFPNTTSGSYDETFDTRDDESTFTVAFSMGNGGTPEGAEAALFAGLSVGKAYFNIHTSTYPGGEIRGFLTEVPEASVPEALTVWLAGFGLAAAGIARRLWR